MSLKIPGAHKKRSRMHLKSPLPVPLFSASEEQKQHLKTPTLFRGFFKYGAVIIEDPRFADMLWENGYFGDGNLSSSGMRYKVKLEMKRNNEGSRTDEFQRNLNVQNLNEEEKGTDKTVHFTEVLSEDKIMKTNPQYEIAEVLHLCLEEALFLSYALGTLVLTDEDGCEMDIDAMWAAFRKLNPQFPLQYAVYHHFRCKGWVVKPGTKFGADWVLYPVGPPFYHSQYLVWVQCLWKENLTEDFSLSSRRSDVADLSALERLSGHVGKAMLLCQVLRSVHLTEDDLNSVECLQRFIISEVILQRWMSNSEVSSKHTPDVPSQSSSKGEKRPSDTNP